MIKSGIIGLAAVALAAIATPASAVITFAQFSPSVQASNVRWVNNGAASNTSTTNTATGSGGYFYTTSTATSRVPGNVAVNFEFLQPQLAFLGPIDANFFMSITVTNTPALAQGQFRFQDIPSGSFSFTSTESFTINDTFYAVGTNLLTGTFTSGVIFGTGTSGSFSGNTTDGALTYTSDVLNFTNTTGRDYSMSLTSISPNLFRSNSARALRTFRAFATGSFSSDPAPLINAAIPEPKTWAMFVVGFGLVGFQVRRRATRTVAA